MADQFDSSKVIDHGIPLTAAEKLAFDQALGATDHAAVAPTTLLPQRRALAVVEQAVARTEADRKTVANDRVRSTAGLVNMIASTVLAAGVATPAVGALFPTSTFANHGTQVWFLTIGCVVGAALLHWANRTLLGGLRA